jgi:hypothetical protein
VLVARAERHLLAYGSANKYKPVSKSKASGMSAKMPIHTADFSCINATMFTMVATVKAMDNQR